MNETERVRRIMDKEAPRYDRQMNFFDRRLFTGGREWACGSAEGDVLEVAVGSGRNLSFYPPGTNLTGIEFSSEMLKLAEQRAAEMGAQVDLRMGDAQVLEFEDESFDTIVCTLALCTIPDPAKAVREAFRVLRPGGSYRGLEHVRSPVVAVRGVQRVLDPLSVRFAGDHVVREPLDYLRPAGFEIEQLERSKWGIVERVVGRKPAA
ncbi:MAG: class I SAM-dependent methyltransferase [Solirubrobacterales bacterium]